ncbi:hypothetical protein FS749_008087 [Ceratobasidium sp. UAMH 11750]|nr:hypothetical protein FS749_008087 [Ceratobasidium sp. UAMH 11750]
MATDANYNDVDINFGEWLNLSLIENDSNNTDDAFSPVPPPSSVYPKLPVAYTGSPEETELVASALFAHPDSTVTPRWTIDTPDPSITQYSPLQLMPLSSIEQMPPAPPTPITELFLTPDSRWQAIIDRIPNAPFVYGVLSTRIYCRTTCPARRPLRDNVNFYNSPSEAVAAGFRPCKRCKPDDAAGEAAEQRQAAAVERAKGLIEEASRNGEKIPLDRLASEAGLSTFYFHRVFRKRVGVTPEEWGKRCRQRGSRS